MADDPVALKQNEHDNLTTVNTYTGPPYIGAISRRRIQITSIGLAENGTFSHVTISMTQARDLMKWLNEGFTYFWKDEVD